MKKYYYIDLGSVPFAKTHIYNEPLAKLPKYWKVMTKKEYDEYMNRDTYIPNAD